MRAIKQKQNDDVKNAVKQREKRKNIQNDTHITKLQKGTKLLTTLKY